MICESFHIERAPASDGSERNAIVFELRPLEAVSERVEAEPAPRGGSLDELRQQALAAAAQPVQLAAQSTRNVYQRSRDIRTYVLARAKGNCEGCGAPAPFIRIDGTPYLEPHHLLRLSDGGPDHPGHVIALCPNCHRRVHVEVDGKAYNDELVGRVATIEG